MGRLGAKGRHRYHLNSSHDDLLDEQDNLQPIADVSKDDPEVKKSIQSHAVNVEQAKGMTEFVFSKYSVWNRLKKIVAWLLRYKHWVQLKIERDEEALKSAIGKSFRGKIWQRWSCAICQGENHEIGIG